MKSFGDLVKQAQKMQKQMAEAQERLEEERFSSSAGGGMVSATVDGRGRLIEIKLDPKALEDPDASLLEDLIMTAVGEGQRTAEAHMKEALGKLTGGINLPF